MTTTTLELSRPTVEITDDGRPHLTISKSWLASYRYCPKQAQEKIVDPDTPGPISWQAELGTACHLGIEGTVRAWIEAGRVGGAPESQTHAVWRRALDYWAESWETNDLGSQDRAPRTMEHGQATIVDIGGRWLNWATGARGRDKNGDPIPNLHPDVSEWKVEKRYTRKLYDGDEGIITFTGTPDLVTAERAYDWKTGTVPPFWEVDRYDHQTTVYSFLTERPCALVFAPRRWDAEPVTEHLPKRTEAHVGALTAEVVEILGHIGTVSSWTRRPSGWWCSGRWCREHAQGKCHAQFVEIHRR